MKEILIHELKRKRENSHITLRTSHNSGITLVALIITIIVLLILAVVAIRAISEDGIIAKAKYSKEEQRGAKVQEQKELFEIELKISKYDGGTQKTVNDLLDKLEEEKLITEEEKNAIIETGRITIGSKEIIFPEDAILPDGYTRCEYLENINSCQYINTGILASSSVEYELEFQCPYYLGGVNQIFGGRIRYFPSINCAMNDNVSGAYGNSKLYEFKFNFTNLNQKFRISVFDAVLNCNDVLGRTDLTTNFSTGYNIYLFTLNDQGTADTRSSHNRIYSCKLYENSVIVRDFIPCLDKNEKPCMYDTVSKTPFYNQGTGEFIAGPIVE